MPSLYIREVPIPLYRKLKECAKADRRSLQKETIWFLEKAIEGETPLITNWGRMRRFQESMQRYGTLSTTTTMIREMRDAR